MSKCVCGHDRGDHQRKRFITDYTAPCDQCPCKDFDVPKEPKIAPWDDAASLPDQQDAT